MRVTVYHGYYGCDTGCCGHWVELEDGTRSFDFTHCYIDSKDVEARKQWARDLVEAEFGTEHCADLDWDNCVLSGGDC
jgi:hypothetical protein